jgi:hypothetical protein
MRVAQFLVPATHEGGDAQFILYYFGQGQGGSVDDNIARWQSQFSSSDGASVTPRVEVLVVNGMPVTIAELTGTYARNVGMGQTGKAQRCSIRLEGLPAQYEFSLRPGTAAGSPGEYLELPSRHCLSSLSSSFLLQVTMSQKSLLFKHPVLSDYR